MDFRGGIVAKLALQAATLVCNLVVTRIALRGLGSDAYGLFVTTGSLVQWLTLLSVGTSFSFPRQIAQDCGRADPEAVRRAVATTFGFNLIVGLLVALVSAAGAGLAPRLLKTPAGMESAAITLVIYAGVNLTLSLVLGAAQSTLMGIGRLRWIGLSGLVQTLVYTVLALIAVRRGAGVIGLAAAQLLGTAAATLTGTLVVRRYAPAGSLRPSAFSGALLRSLATPSLFYFFAQIAGLVTFTLDNIIIASRLGVGEVADYAILYRIEQLAISFIFPVYDMLFGSLASTQAAEQHDALKRLHNLGLKLTMAGAAATALGLLFAGRLLVTLWVGSDHYAGDTILYCMIATLLVSSYLHALAVCQSALGQHRALGLVALLETVLNLSLSLVLVQSMGRAGVALATLIAALPSSILAYRMTALGVDRSAPWDMLRRALGPALLPALPAALIGWSLVYVGLPVLVAALAAPAGYAILFFYFGVAGDERAFLGGRLAERLGLGALGRP